MEMERRKERIKERGRWTLRKNSSSILQNSSCNSLYWVVGKNHEYLK
jgi:hypothetical protein